MSLVDLFLLLLAGLLAGIGAGLLGIGGGLVLVPALTWILGRQGVALEEAVTMAVATALAAIVFTAVSSVWAHQRRGAVEWPVIRVMGAWIAIGAVAGGVLGDYLGGDVLARVFAVFAFLVALRMWFGNHQVRATPHALRWPRPVAVLIGALSAMVGIGGGSMTVPYLQWHGLAMARCVATGSGLGYPIALSSALTYVVLGWREPINVPHWGYVYWPGMLVVVVSSVISAPWGAALAHYWSPRRVARLFAVLLAIVAVRMGLALS